MHLPDGVLSAPVAAAAAGLSSAALALAWRRSRRCYGEEEAGRVGVLAGFVFAAQMVNFPVFAGVSGHLLGSALLALLLGPARGMLAMAMVLVVQALWLHDGGISALGANLLDMAVLGVGGAWVCWRSVEGRAVGRWSWRWGVGLAAWTSVVLAAAGTALQLGLSGTVPLREAAAVMLTVHVPVGIVEAAITVPLVETVAAARPGLSRVSTVGGKR
jgi:cobalt/nickel transport system permease protein